MRYRDKSTMLLEVDLALFDGAAGAAAPSGGEGETGAQAETQAIPGGSRRGRRAGGAERVAYGKQAEQAQPQEGSDAGSDDQGEADAFESVEDRRAKFEKLISEEYKDLFTERTQSIIDRRFKETKALEERTAAQQPILELLAQKYKVEDADPKKLMEAIEQDDSYWENAAEEAGMTVEQYKQYQRLERENRRLMEAQRARQSEQAARQQLQQWYRQAEEVQKRYPGFDLSAECEDREFLSMLKAGVPMQHAYEVRHLSDIKTDVAAQTAKRTEKQVVDGIRAKGARPTENGVSSQSGITIKSDVSKLSRKDREEIARRVARGEKIEF